MKWSVVVSVATVCLFALLVNGPSPVTGEPGENCARPCDGSPRLCEWAFDVEWYQTMAKACYECPFVEADCYRPHCVTGDGNSRAFIAINRQYPGPAIEVCEGDTVKVKVTNKMVNGESITIHWHGQHQRGTPYMDGTDMVTQCPIVERAYFTYEFIAGPVGTHLYHAHTGIQMSDGMLGAFIVHPNSDDPAYDLYDHDCDTPTGHCEFVVAVQDWMEEPYLIRWAREVFTGKESPISSLVNGKMKRYPVTNDNGDEAYTPYTVFNVESGKRYRFRLMMEGARPGAYKVSIEGGHKLTVVAADGHCVQPVDVEAIAAFSGERYDFILTADGDSGTNYWLKAHHTGHPPGERPNAYAIIRYNDAPDEEPTGDKDADQATGMFLQPILGKADDPDLTYSHGAGSDMNADELDSAYDEDFTDEVVDHTYYFTLSMPYNDNSRYQNKEYYPLSSLPMSQRRASAVIDNITFLIPPVPILSQVEDIDFSLVCNRDSVDHSQCVDDLCVCVHALLYPQDEIVEFIILNDGATGHPMHLHGNAFRLLGVDRIGEGINMEMMKEMNENGELKKKLVNPSYRDTVNIHDHSYAVIRFKTDNPGYWLFHCHLTDHIDLGQIVLLGIGNHADLPPVPKGFRRCGNWETADKAQCQSNGSKRRKR